MGLTMLNNAYIFKDRVEVISGFYKGLIGCAIKISELADVDGNYCYLIVKSNTVSHRYMGRSHFEKSITVNNPEIWVNEKDLKFHESKRTFMNYIIPIFGLFTIIGIVFLKLKSKDIKNEKV